MSLMSELTLTTRGATWCYLPPRGGKITNEAASQ